MFVKSSPIFFLNKDWIFLLFLFEGQTHEVDDQDSLPFTNLKDISDVKYPTSTDDDKSTDNVGSTDTTKRPLQEAQQIPSEPAPTTAITLGNKTNHIKSETDLKPVS